MGRVRTKTVKKASRVIIEKYYTKLTLDFDTNKRIIEEVALIPSKPLRNKIAGFITHLVWHFNSYGLRLIKPKDLTLCSLYFWLFDHELSIYTFYM